MAMTLEEAEKRIETLEGVVLQALKSMEKLAEQTERISIILHQLTTPGGS